MYTQLQFCIFLVSAPKPKKQPPPPPKKRKQTPPPPKKRPIKANRHIAPPTLIEPPTLESHPKFEPPIFEPPIIIEAAPSSIEPPPTIEPSPSLPEKPAPKPISAENVPPAAPAVDYSDEFHNFISFHMPEARLQLRFPEQLVYYVPPTVRLSDTFMFMEHSHGMDFNIDSYAINKMTLRQLFSIYNSDVCDM